MALPTRPAQGFSRMGLLAVLVVIAVLVGVAVSYVLVRAPQIQCRQNAGSIHLATLQMAVDGESNKDSSLGWPGDLKSKGIISNLSDFVTLLVRNDYLKPNDLQIFSGPGYKPYKGTLSNGVLVPPFTEENCAYKVYLVKASDPSTTVFLMSKNGDKGFIVCHIGGDVGLYKKAQPSNFIFPGGGTVESAENCLNPDPTPSRP